MTIVEKCNFELKSQIRLSEFEVFSKKCTFQQWSFRKKISFVLAILWNVTFVVSHLFAIDSQLEWTVCFLRPCSDVADRFLFGSK